MGMVHQEMLKEEDRIKDGHELDTDQVLVFVKGLGFVRGGGVVTKPLLKGKMLLGKVALDV